MAKYSLHFGFNYPNTANALNGCWNDARMMRSVARSMGYRNNRVLLDRQPFSKARVMNEIRQLVGKPNGSQLFLTYSGHGTSLAAGTDKHEKDGKNEALVLSNALLTDGEFFQLIKRLPRRSRLFIVLDCCHSGTGCDLPYILDAGRRAAWKLDRGDTILRNKNFIGMLSGCKDAQYSYERGTGGKVRGALTLAFHNTVRATIRRARRRKGRAKAHLNCLSILRGVRARLNDPAQIPLFSSVKQIRTTTRVF